MKTNNLFKYATSELSQDAFICWLMNFADERHYNEDLVLGDCAKDLLAKIIGTQEDLRITKVTRQYKNIDVLLEVNNKYNIIIEDKTFSDQHGDQINRYRKTLVEEGRDNIICVYYKIVEQSYEEQTDINISRQDLIELFSKYVNKTNNNIFNDYYEYLLSIDISINRYKTEPIEKWTLENDHAYKGFFTHLIKDNIIQVDRRYGWKYVANPSGGIYALWWYLLKGEEFDACNLSGEYLEELFLQVEDNIIAVKMRGTTEHTTDVRWSLYKYIKGKVPYFNKKPFKKGKWMTVGYVEYNEIDYREKITLMENMMKSIVSGEYQYDLCK